MGVSQHPAPTDSDVRADALARTREMIRVQRRGRRDRWPPVVFGSTYIVFALLALTHVRSISWGEVAAICLLLPVYVAAQRLGLDEDAGGSFVMTQSLFVVMLFLVPLPLVPAVVLVGVVLGAPRDPTSYHPIYKLFYRAMSGWFAVGPVVVLALAADGPPSLDQWPVYVAALLAQFLCDGMVSYGCAYATTGSVAGEARSLLWGDAMDVLLASIGLASVLATDGSLWAIAFASTPFAMLLLVTRDRQAQVARAVAVTDAFEEVVEQSFIDPLTGLANRRKWNEAVEAAEVQRRKDPELVATAVLADVDGLKCVNDSLGHHAGDELIIAAGGLMRDIAPPDALVARVGGDEFAMLSVHKRGEVSSSDLVARIRAGAMGRKTSVGTQLSMSLGAATCPAAKSVQAAVELADTRTLDDKRRRKVGRR